jgi:NAD(P)-dependent dehydrogenase (short-subunit alcohol dehydrogenase family)
MKLTRGESPGGAAVTAGKRDRRRAPRVPRPEILEIGGRVVMISSARHRRANVDPQDPNFERTPYDELTAYGQSKTATILLAVEFDDATAPRA